jgi:indole-3-glycerol phosphate synthase
LTERFLESILREVRSEVGRPEYFETLPTAPHRRPPSLRVAIDRERAGGALIVEYKRVSPGQAEPVLPRRTPQEFLLATNVAGVAGYSCLATRARFDGSPRDVAEIAGRTERPVLFKEFVVDPRQVEAAARAGASAILLIARLESVGALHPSLAELGTLAHERGLEVLLEFHDGAELRRADDLPADMYGVNARNLETLTIDRPTAEATFATARANGLHPLLGLSGIAHSLDARRLWDAGADGLLVGTAVARSDDPAAFLASLRRVPGGVR